MSYGMGETPSGLPDQGGQTNLLANLLKALSRK
jgi:hypothetical protein